MKSCWDLEIKVWCLGFVPPKYQILVAHRESRKGLRGLSYGDPLKPKPYRDYYTGTSFGICSSMPD